MTTDLFGGIFDNLRGYSDSISDIFSRGSSVASAKIQETPMIYTRSAKGSGFSSFLSDAATDVSSGFKFSSPEVDLRSGLTEMHNNSVRAGAKGTIEAVDPSAFEAEWISRLSKFAKIEDYVKQSDVKLKS